MTETIAEYRTEGENSLYAGPDGKVVPVVTRAGKEDTNTAQSGDCIRVSGVSIQHTPATKIWFGQVSNVPGYRSLPHHHGKRKPAAMSCGARGGSTTAKTTLSTWT